MWIRVRESDAEMEDAAAVRSALWSAEIRVPGFDVLLKRTGTDPDCGNVIILDLFEIAEQSSSTESALLLEKRVAEDVDVAVAASLGHLDALHHLIKILGVAVFKPSPPNNYGLPSPGSFSNFFN